MRAQRIIATVAAAATIFTLAACSSDSSSTGENNSASSSNSADSAAFPVTIKHAFGETTIEKAPERVATVGWANHEVPLALGVVPVGMSKTTWGDDDNNGVLPWTEEKLKELGAETPVLFDETDGIPFEQVADTQPDVILASYSGLTQEDYDTLSKIAPVVAYPDVAWATSLEDMIEMNAESIGKKDEGEKLIKDLDAQTEKALDKYPALKDKKVLFTAFGGSTDASKIGFYTTDDPRMGFLAEHGLGTPDIVERTPRTPSSSGSRSPLRSQKSSTTLTSSWPTPPETPTMTRRPSRRCRRIRSRARSRQFRRATWSSSRTARWALRRTSPRCLFRGASTSTSSS